MHTFKTISILALAATTAFAAPAPVEGHAIEARDPGYGGGRWRGGNRWWYRPNSGATVTVTGYGGDDAAQTEAPAAAIPTTTAEAVAQPTITAAADNNANFRGSWGGNQGSSAPASSAAAVPVASSAPSTPSVGGGGDWFSIANKWRTAIGGAAFTEDSTLVSNAQNTADSSGGQLIHKLNPGSFAQVLAPGDASNFESVFLGGWLCEVPSLPGLSSVCGAASQGWNHAGQTGHADIIANAKYTKIGCALGDGIWSCDFA